MDFVKLIVIVVLLALLAAGVFFFAGHVAGYSDVITTSVSHLNNSEDYYIYKQPMSFAKDIFSMISKGDGFSFVVGLFSILGVGVLVMIIFKLARSVMS